MQFLREKPAWRRASKQPSLRRRKYQKRWRRSAVRTLKTRTLKKCFNHEDTRLNGWLLQPVSRRCESSNKTTKAATQDNRCFQLTSCCARTLRSISRTSQAENGIRSYKNHGTDHVSKKGRTHAEKLLLLLWFTQESSHFLWSSAIGNVILKPMQFPWRFLVLAGFALAFLAGFDARRAPTWTALLLCVILIAGSYNYTNALIIEPPEGPVSFAGLPSMLHKLLESSCIYHNFWKKRASARWLLA